MCGVDNKEKQKAYKLGKRQNRNDMAHKIAEMVMWQVHEQDVYVCQNGNEEM